MNFDKHMWTCNIGFIVGFYLKNLWRKRTYLIKMIKWPSIREINLVEFNCITFFLVDVTKMVRVEGINMTIHDFVNAFLIVIYSEHVCTTVCVLFEHNLVTISCGF